jgi:hypothetical protein
VAGIEVSSGELKRRLNDAQRAEVDHHLASGRGVALFEDERGRPDLIVTFGARGCDIETRFPPSHYGRGALHSFVYAPVESKPMRSPLMEWEGGPPQIARPRVSPAFTEVPEVSINMRTSSHPRGHSGYITPGRYPVEAAPEPVLPQQPPRELSESEKWWSNKLSH